MYVAEDWVQYDQRKKHEMAVHVTSVGQEICIHGFGGEN